MLTILILRWKIWLSGMQRISREEQWAHRSRDFYRGKLKTKKKCTLYIFYGPLKVPGLLVTTLATPLLDSPTMQWNYAYQFHARLSLFPSNHQINKCSAFLFVVQHKTSSYGKETCRYTTSAEILLKSHLNKDYSTTMHNANVPSSIKEFDLNNDISKTELDEESFEQTCLAKFKGLI